LCKIS
jgi:fructose-bisphosphate aldolase class II